MGTEHTHTPSSSSSCHPSHRTQPYPMSPNLWHTQHTPSPTQIQPKLWSQTSLAPACQPSMVCGASPETATALLPRLAAAQRSSLESIDRVGWLGFGRAIYICGPLLPHFVQTIKMATTLNISKKRKFVADGVFYSEVNEVIQVTVDRFGCSLTGLGG